MTPTMESRVRSLAEVSQSFINANFMIDVFIHIYNVLSGNLGSLTKHVKNEERTVLSTPQSVPHASTFKMCGHVYSVEHNSVTPTLPQGAAAERQHHLSKKDVNIDK